MNAPLQFILAGNALFTVENTATGNRFTFKVRKPDDDKPHFVSVLTGPDNEHDYAFLGTVFDPRSLPPRAALPHCPGCAERAGVRVALPAVERGPSAAAASAAVPLREVWPLRQDADRARVRGVGLRPRVHQDHRGRRAMKALRRLMRALFAESLADLGALLRSLDQKPKPNKR